METRERPGALEQLSEKETPADRLDRIHLEVVEINHHLFMTDAALGSRDGWTKRKLIDAAQVSLTFLRERLDDVSEELELMVSEARGAAQRAGDDA